MKTMSTQQPDLRTAAQAVIDRWETPLWKDAPATAGYIAALRDALAADHTEHHLEMAGRWYMVTLDGAATLCVDREDAEAEARKADREWPRNGPHRAVQLVEASFEAADMAAAAAQGFRDGVASVAASAGELTPAHIKAMERAWQWMENQADGQSKGGHATFDLMMLREERDALRAAIDVAAPPTAQAEGWISVDERLPEPNVEVLCAGQGWGNPFVTACYYDDERREWHQINTHWTDSTGCAQYPTHWMPLPPPPTSAEGVDHG